MPGYWSQDLNEKALSSDARRRLQTELANWMDGGGKEGESPILRGIEYQKVGTGIHAEGRAGGRGSHL